jgi:hypothetical protein
MHLSSENLLRPPDPFHHQPDFQKHKAMQLAIRRWALTENIAEWRRNKDPVQKTALLLLPGTFAHGPFNSKGLLRHLTTTDRPATENCFQAASGLHVQDREEESRWASGGRIPG